MLSESQSVRGLGRNVVLPFQLCHVRGSGHMHQDSRTCSRCPDVGECKSKAPATECSKSRLITPGQIIRLNIGGSRRMFLVLKYSDTIQTGDYYQTLAGCWSLSNIPVTEKQYDSLFSYHEPHEKWRVTTKAGETVASHALRIYVRPLF